MKITQSHLGSFVLTILLAFCLLLIARESFAETETEAVIQDGKVEVIYSAEALSSYRQRRPSHSIVFGVTVDNLFPEKFRSKIDGAAYKELFGSSVVPLVQADLGIKYNFGLGGVYGGVILGTGEVSDSPNGESTTLNLRKKGLTAGFYMDNMFEEPYVVPYVSGQVFSFDWEESTKSLGSKTGATAYTSAIQVGVLLQLNWLDPEASLAAQNASNLNNTFIDMFASQYNTSNGSDDPNFQTDFNFGVGLRLEY